MTYAMQAHIGDVLAHLPLIVARPIVKWAGGKTKLLPQLLEIAPQQIRKYYEPMCGGAALFFALAREGRMRAAVLGDANDELVNLYKVVADGPDILIDALAGMHNNRRTYDAIRAWDLAKTSDVMRAARMLYLNKTCFNGLYRVNKNGGFNVPFAGYKNPAICDEANLRAAHAAFTRYDVEFVSQSVFWQAQLRNESPHGVPAEEDFVYFDPPYVPASKTANFTAFHADGFGMADQARLAILFRKLADRGVPVALSNSDTPEVRALYAGLPIARVEMPRAINSRGGGRGKVGEVVVAANCRLNNRLFRGGR